MKNIITIGREFGSGGREIGKKVAEALGIAYYDKELLGIAAKESGLSPKFLEEYDEKNSGSLLYSLVMGQSNMFFAGSTNTSVENLASTAQRNAVLNVAEKGSCVIVGRCADYILRDRADVLRVFINAAEADKISRVMKRDSLSEKEAKEKIKRMDKARRAYYNCNTESEWGAAKSYDLCINVSRLTPQQAVDIIVYTAKDD